MKSTRLLSAALVPLLLGLSPLARADTSAVRLASALKQLPDGGRRFLALSGAGTDSGRGQVLVRVDSAFEARELGLIPISSRWAVGSGTPNDWQRWRAASTVETLRFAPARKPMLDRVGPHVQADLAGELFGLQGEGTVIGIVDTGGDVAHPALRNADGTTRVAWMLAYGREPLGNHLDLEEEYGCNDEEEPCAVFSRADLDEILESNILANLPKDRIGHGTHISSLAAGRDEEYPGIAPLADLILVAAASSSGTVSDARILVGTRFVFDRAAEMAQPAVVNVSLGSAFGAHDGSSAIEQGLADLGQGEGRAVVVAAGNSGSVVHGLTDDYPEPLGIHNQVAVPKDTLVRVPLLSTPGLTEQTSGSIFVWISTLEGDELSVGFHNGLGEETALVPPGELGSVPSSDLDDKDNYDVILLNGVDDIDSQIMPGSLVVAITGDWEAGRTFELTLQGQGTAHIWVTGTSGAGAAAGGYGPLLTRAQDHGTVAVPGSSPDLITVGSVTNRLTWTDHTGTENYSPGEEPGRSSFSAAGPNQLGDMKPELVAPGGRVIGAMSDSSDPRRALSPFSQFAANGACPGDTECLVIDDEHGLATGTSMAAPLVTGAVALLMQRQPELTMAEAKRFLMAGTSEVIDEPVWSKAGTGTLNIVGALLAQELSVIEEFKPLDKEYTRVAWAADFVRPAPAPPLQAKVVLRDEDSFPTIVSDDEIQIEVDGPGHADWHLEGTGLVHIDLSADAGTEGHDLKVRIKAGDLELNSVTIPIARDPQLAKYGYELGGGTCQLAPGRQSSDFGWLWLGLLAFGFNRRRAAD